MRHPPGSKMTYSAFQLPIRQVSFTTMTDSHISKFSKLLIESQLKLHSLFFKQQKLDFVPTVLAYLILLADKKRVVSADRSIRNNSEIFSTSEKQINDNY